MITIIERSTDAFLLSDQEGISNVFSWHNFQVSARESVYLTHHNKKAKFSLHGYVNNFKKQMLQNSV